MLRASRTATGQALDKRINVEAVDTAITISIARTLPRQRGVVDVVLGRIRDRGDERINVEAVNTTVAVSVAPITMTVARAFIRDTVAVGVLRCALVDVTPVKDIGAVAITAPGTAIAIIQITFVGHLVTVTIRVKNTVRPGNIHLEITGGTARARDSDPVSVGVGVDAE